MDINVTRVYCESYESYTDTERMRRGKTDKLFLVHITQDSKNDACPLTVDVMGTTGNVYKVRICENPTCTCPDFIKRGRRCKHIYFVLEKVLNAHEYANQKRFMSSTLRKLCSNMTRMVSELYAPKQLYMKYEKTKVHDDDSTVKQKGLDDVCPVCLCDMELQGDQQLDFCRNGCGRTIHVQCFDMWANANSRTCVFCHEKWWDCDRCQYVNLYE